MAAAPVQTGTALNVGGGTSGTITLTSVTAGDLLIVYADDIDGASVTFSVSDDKSNTWAQAVHNDNSGYSATIWYCLSAASGTTIITVTASSSTSFLAQAQEYSGGTWTLETTSSIDESATTSHVCAGSPSVIDTTGENLVVCNSTTNDGGNFGTRTAGTGYTGLTSPTAQAFWQYQIFSTAQANEQGAFTSANSKATAACIAAFKLTAAPCSPCWWPCCTPCAVFSDLYVCGTGSGGSQDVDSYSFDSWVNSTNLPAGRGRALCAGWSHLGDSGYIAGGYVAAGSQNDTDHFSTGSGWTAKTDHPSPARYHVRGDYIAGYGYLVFGRNGPTLADIKDTDQFDTAGDSWASKTDGTTAKYNHVGATISDKQYTSTGNAGFLDTRDTDEYDPVGDSWTSKTQIPTPARDAAAGFALDDKLYVSGGADSGNLRDTDEYDPAGNSWASVSDILTPARAGHGGATLGTAGYISGSNAGTQDHHEEYVPDVWTSRTSLLAGRVQQGEFAI